MKIGKILRPGQAGTKKWVEKFGDDLICVRYRYDKVSRRRLKTVELIVEQSDWQINVKRIPRNKLLPIRLGYEETHLRKVIMAAGGRWNGKTKVWKLPYGEIKALGLEKRIIQEG